MRSKFQVDETSGSIRLPRGEVRFDIVDLQAAIRIIESSHSPGWKIVITPNLHHLQMLMQDDELAPLYERADLVLPDGWPAAALLSRREGRTVTRVTGSDLLDQLLETPGHGRRIGFVGGDSRAVRDRLFARAVQSGWKSWTDGASLEVMADADARSALAGSIARECDGGIVALGVGAPKQERFAYEIQAAKGSGWILCVGQALNFSGGASRRAPEWMQRSGFEWMHRALTEPRRLIPRYAADLLALARIVPMNLRRAT